MLKLPENPPPVSDELTVNCASLPNETEKVLISESVTPIVLLCWAPIAKFIKYEKL
jgi:hypothetical protein